MVTPTPAQAQIRDHQSLNLRVLAPAGCGKTEALALRVAGLIARGDIRAPHKILVATFSNRARDNVRDRLASYLSPAVRRDRVTVSNFHGLSARIYQAHASAVGIDATWSIPENDWVGQQCRQLKLSFKMAAAIHDTLRTAKQQAADDDAVGLSLEAAGYQVAIDIEQLRRAEQRLTYDDLPRLAELILANDTVAALYRHHFAAVIIDEFQDLTPQQLRIVNRIGYGRTTYAGDLAQGIYGFAGASPDLIDRTVRDECGEHNLVEFSESHRSSPAVLELVNSLTPLTGGTSLTSADPTSWPSGGLAGRAGFKNTEDEANYVVTFAKFVLSAAPNHRVGVISRSNPRRRFVDQVAAQSGLEVHRWEDGVLDTDTARVVKAMLTKLTETEFRDATDKVAYLRMATNIDAVQDPSSRQALADALDWCHDLLDSGVAPAEVRARVRIGDQDTLLSVAGLHLLTGHVGKGQQFDWVVVIGAEEGCIPDFRATTQDERIEEARVLSVMLSRARHGALVTYATAVPAGDGTVYTKKPSSFGPYLSTTTWRDRLGVKTWLAEADWAAIAAR